MGILQLPAPPSIAPVISTTTTIVGGREEEDPHWSSFDKSVNAVSFGLVATAILISMFLAMAIFERFLRPRPSSSAGGSGGGNRGDLEAQMMYGGKLEYPSPKMTIYARGVLMPGDEIPTYIAHAAPAPSNAICTECASRCCNAQHINA